MQYFACFPCGGSGRRPVQPIRALMVLALIQALVACEGSSSLAPSSLTVPPTRAESPIEVPSPRVGATPTRGPAYGRFRFTMYYVAVEEPVGAARPDDDDDDEATGASEATGAGEATGASEATDAVLASTARPDRVTLFHRDGCTPLAEVDRAFARQLHLQGTGKLRDGRVVNTSGSCRCPRSPCFMEIHAAWAIGANSGRLAPFRSVAVDPQVVPLGTILYVPELDGVRMPGKAPWGGFVHDGCVVAEDRGGGIRGHSLDFFVAKKPYSGAIYRRTRLKEVTVHHGRGWCERRDGRLARVGGAS
jgi:3D (Asp-Asp-Asp) domain-containing protein